MRAASLVKARGVFPYSNHNITRVYRDAADLLPSVCKNMTRMLDTLPLGALLLSVLYAPSTCAAAVHLSAAAVAAQTPIELNEDAHDVILQHINSKDPRCYKLGLRWAHEVWTKDNTTEHMKILYCMVWGLLQEFAQKRV